MKETSSEMEGRSPNFDDRVNSLATFEKVDRAMRLVEEAVKERPFLKELQIEPLMRSLAEGLRILSAKNSELNLQGLMLKYGWCVGQRFYVRTISRTKPELTFSVLPAQDIPEGVVIVAKARRGMQVSDGELIALDLEIKRGVRKPMWHIRALDHE